MAWTTPGTAVAGEVLTAARWNTEVRDNPTFLYAPPMCKVRRTSNVTSYTSASAISWSQEDFDTDGMFSSGTNVTINTAGVYLIKVNIFLEATATMTNLGGNILIGGALRQYLYFPARTTTSAYAEVTKIISLSAGSVVTAAAEPVGGSAYIIRGSATDDHTSTSLSVMWLGKA